MRGKAHGFCQDLAEGPAEDRDRCAERAGARQRRRGALFEVLHPRRHESAADDLLCLAHAAVHLARG